MSSSVRRASHAGSWYNKSVKELDKQLEGWLSTAGLQGLTHGPARAIIVPHAGYVYCGETAAHAYRQVGPAGVERVFILGPSHHVRLSGCALSSVGKYEALFYDLPIDHGVYAQLEGTGAFERMSQTVDEDEHSLEMTLPFIAKVMENHKSSFRIVPVMVGSLSPEKEAKYGSIFAPYLADPSNLFVVSSDFCHWGQRFHYTHYEPRDGKIFESIGALDRRAMDVIQTLQPPAFTDYLKKTGNTICGRHPIGVLLNAVDKLGPEVKGKCELRFLKYAQSNHCVDQNDSSVSYAAASLTAP